MDKRTVDLAVDEHSNDWSNALNTEPDSGRENRNRIGGRTGIVLKFWLYWFISTATVWLKETVRTDRRTDFTWRWPWWRTISDTDVTATEWRTKRTRRNLKLLEEQSTPAGRRISDTNKYDGSGLHEKLRRGQTIQRAHYLTAPNRTAKQLGCEPEWN